MAVVIAAVQQKGGCGKSTLISNLAVAAAREGKSCCILELDRQGTLTEFSKKRGFAPFVEMIDHDEMAALIKELSNEVDIIFVDVPGIGSIAASEAVRLADYILVPSRPADTDLSPAAYVVKLAKQFEKPYKFVMSLAPSSSGRSNAARRMLESAGHEVANAELQHRLQYIDALASGRGVLELEPDGRAAQEVLSVWSEVKEDIGL